MREEEGGVPYIVFNTKPSILDVKPGNSYMVALWAPGNAVGETADYTNTEEDVLKAENFLVDDKCAKVTTFRVLSAGVITSATATEGQYFLVGNPFMCHLDMKAFFAENQNLNPKYWIIDANHQEVAVMDDAIGADSSDPEAYVAPLQSFFVEAKTAGTSISLNYKKEMMAANPVEGIKVGGEDNLPGNVPTNGPIGTIPDLFPLPSSLFPLPSSLLPPPSYLLPLPSYLLPLPSYLLPLPSYLLPLPSSLFITRKA